MPPIACPGRVALLVVAALLLCSCALASARSAASPGTDGAVFAIASEQGLVVAPIDGGPVQPLIAIGAGETVRGPAWRPDGALIAFECVSPFQRDGKNGSGVQVVAPDGSDVPQLNPVIGDGDLAWPLRR